MHGDRPLLGIALVIAFSILAPATDGVAKLIGEAVPLILVVATRFVFQVGLLAPIAALRRRPVAWSGRLAALIAARAVLHVAGIGFMVLSVRYLPLAEAIAIAFVMPFILILIGWLILGEEVGPARLGACAAGFVGTLLVMQPSFAEVGPPALLPLMVAVIFAFFMVITRICSREIEAITLQAVSGGISLVLMLPALLLTAPAFGTLSPNAPLLVLMGVMGTAAHLLMTLSLRFAPASTLAPIQYVEIPVAALLGLLVFGDFPNGIALLGIAVTIGAGLFIVLRERRLSRTAPVPQGPAPPAA